MIRVQVADVLQQGEDQYTVMLLNKENERLMGIWVGFLEGPFIGWLGAKQPWVWGGPRRPFTINLLGKIMRDHGVFVRDAQIVSEKDGIFYALVRIRTADGDREVDCRPSDAIALALQMNRPIYADPEVMDPVTWHVSEVYRGEVKLGEFMEATPEAMLKWWEKKNPQVVSNLTLRLPLAPLAIGPEGDPVEVWLADVIPKNSLTKIAVLHERDGVRIFPIQMPIWEAYFLAAQSAGLDKKAPPHQVRRPNTVEFFVELLRAAGLTLHQSILNHIRDEVVFGSLEVSGREGSMQFDARPYDAIALAHELGLPLLVRSSVLEYAGMSWIKLYKTRDQIGKGLKKAVRDFDVPLHRRTLTDRIRALLG